MEPNRHNLTHKYGRTPRRFQLNAMRHHSRRVPRKKNEKKNGTKKRGITECEMLYCRSVTHLLAAFGRLHGPGNTHKPNDVQQNGALCDSHLA